MPKNDDAPTMFDDMTGGSSAVATTDTYVPAPKVTWNVQARPRVTQLSIPNLRIAQPMSPEVAKDETAKVGDFLLENYDPCKEVQFIPIATTLIRNYKPAGSRETSCQSPDGALGYGDPGDALRAEGKGCAECPMSKWGARDPKTGKGAPPPCKEGLTILGYSVTHGELVQMRFMAQNMRTAAFIEKKAVTDGYCNFCVRLQTTRSSNDKGTWASPMMYLDTSVSADDFAMAYKWRDLFIASQDPNYVPPADMEPEAVPATPPPPRATKRGDVVTPDAVIPPGEEDEPPF